jgi:hypothetical protein
VKEILKENKMYIIGEDIDLSNTNRPEDMSHVQHLLLRNIFPIF